MGMIGRSFSDDREWFDRHPEAGTRGEITMPDGSKREAIRLPDGKVMFLENSFTAKWKEEDE